VEARGATEGEADSHKKRSLTAIPGAMVHKVHCGPVGKAGCGMQHLRPQHSEAFTPASLRCGTTGMRTLSKVLSQRKAKAFRNSG
jgi:hypothetical protein